MTLYEIKHDCICFILKQDKMYRDNILKKGNIVIYIEDQSPVFSRVLSCFGVVEVLNARIGKL